jgi:hypothetical protein
MKHAQLREKKSLGKPKFIVHTKSSREETGEAWWGTDLGVEGHDGGVQVLAGVHDLLLCSRVEELRLINK